VSAAARAPGDAGLVPVVAATALVWLVLRLRLGAEPALACLLAATGS
jgi:hypothetical protein